MNWYKLASRHTFAIGAIYDSGEAFVYLDGKRYRMERVNSRILKKLEILAKHSNWTNFFELFNHLKPKRQDFGGDTLFDEEKE